MRFMILVRAPESSAAEMTAYHEQLAKAGVLLDAAAGYTLIQTKTREEAFEWARRFPNAALDRGAAEIEVRQLVTGDAR